MTSFTAKQQAFIDYYLITLNGTEAARLAKYQGNDNTLGVIAHENLRKPKIREEIDKRLVAITMSADEALFRMTKIARGDLSQYIDSNGKLDIETLRANGDGQLLKKYKHTKNISTRKDSTFETESYETELYPADSAIRDIMKARGVFGPLGTDDDPIKHAISVVNMDVGKLKDKE